MSTATKPNHIGHKISRIRELRGLKQEALAIELGVSQQTVSNIEQSETIEPELLENIGNILGVSPEGIRQFSEEAVFNIIGNTVNNHDNGSFFNHYPTFNPLDKLIEAFEEVKKLQEDNKMLYERLLEAEKEKLAYIERLIGNKNRH